MSKDAVYTADAVAKYLIYLASKERIGDSGEREGITNLKLQKILYFVQAYYMAKKGHPLFSDAIEAWEYGPVIPTIYRKYKSQGSNPIISDKDDSCLNDEDKRRVKKVWEIFGSYSASRLVNVTHAHTPWKEAYQNEEKIISNEVLQEYYTSLFKG